MAETILVVDDDATCRTFLEAYLGSQAYAVFTARDGQAALEELSRVHPDLVVLDVVMPNLDGIEVCRLLKYNPKTRLTPVVLLTSLSETEDRIRALEAGADAVLSKPFNNSELLARVRSLLNLKAYTDELDEAETVLFALARAIESKDPYLEGHCERLSEYSVRLAKRVALPEDQIIAVRRAGIVHDIGKVAVPDSILLKPAALTPEEWKVMRKHPVVGERICSPLKSFRLVLPIIRHHHERLDGTGYPDGLMGSQIPLTARVLQMVDLYDGLTTRRPYKPPLSTEEALEQIDKEVRNGWRDPDLFEELQKMVVEEAPRNRW